MVNSLSSIPCSLIDFFSCLVQVVLPLGVHKEVDAHLLAHLSQKARNKWDFMEDSLHKSSDSRSIPTNERMHEQPEPIIVLSRRKSFNEKVCNCIISNRIGRFVCLPSLKCISFAVIVSAGISAIFYLSILTLVPFIVWVKIYESYKL